MSLRPRFAEPLNDVGGGSLDADADTDSLPFLSLAVQSLVDREDADADNLISGNYPDAANDALDSDATSPLPILGATDADGLASRLPHDVSDSTTTGPMPIFDASNCDPAASLDQPDADTTASLPTLDARNVAATGSLQRVDVVDSEIKTSPSASESGCVDANGPVPGWWTKIRAYIGF